MIKRQGASPGAVRSRADIAPEARPAPAVPRPPVAQAGRQCLIVDDSRVVRKVSRRIVESLGYSVIEAENGEEALARCRASMPDLVITDWNMPVMEGIEFVATLRRIPADRQPKVVFCTTNGGAKDIHKGIEAGADEYVIKPFAEEALLSKLQAIGAA